MTDHPGTTPQAAGGVVKPALCPHCGLRFGDDNALWQHARSKHTRAQAKALRPASTREPSMGDLLAEALIAQACGEPVEDWIRDMFPDEFR